MSAHLPDRTLVETVDRLLRDHCTHETVQEAEAAGWANDMWAPLAAMGAPWVGLSADDGGSGGTWADALAVLRACGAHAVPLPVAETGLLGGWLLATAGLPIPEGPLAVVPGRAEDALRLEGGALSGVAHNVPWAAAAERIIALCAGQIVVIDGSAPAVTIEARRNVAGEPREIVRFDGAVPEHTVAAPAGTAEELRRRGALSRAALMTGALETVSDLTVAYANERQQFGKPVASFQAVSQQLVRLVAETQLVVMALHTTTAALLRGPAPFEIAAFKAIAGEAATSVTARAHQVHGAIGMTQEYGLHQLTRRLWAWREEYGSTTAWRSIVGSYVSAVGSADVWRLVTEGSAASPSL